MSVSGKVYLILQLHHNRNSQDSMALRFLKKTSFCTVKSITMFLVQQIVRYGLDKLLSFIRD